MKPDELKAIKDRAQVLDGAICDDFISLIGHIDDLQMELRLAKNEWGLQQSVAKSYGDALMAMSLHMQETGRGELGKEMFDMVYKFMQDESRKEVEALMNKMYSSFHESEITPEVS